MVQELQSHRASHSALPSDSAYPHVPAPSAGQEEEMTIPRTLETPPLTPSQLREGTRAPERAGIRLRMGGTEQPTAKWRFTWGGYLSTPSRLSLWRAAGRFLASAISAGAGLGASEAGFYLARGSQPFGASSHNLYRLLGLGCRHRSPPLPLSPGCSCHSSLPASLRPQLRTVFVLSFPSFLFPLIAISSRRQLKNLSLPLYFFPFLFPSFLPFSLESSCFHFMPGSCLQGFSPFHGPVAHVLGGWTFNAVIWRF